MGTSLAGNAVIPLASVRTPARVAEARAIATIRKDCLDAGLSGAQLQVVIARARRSLRSGSAPTSTMAAVVARAHVLHAPAPTLLTGLQEALRELLAGRSGATAYQAGVGAMKRSMPAPVDLGGAA